MLSNPTTRLLAWVLISACLTSCGGGGGGGESRGDHLPPSESAAEYKLLEVGPVRPIALSADGKRLFVTNIPANRLELFDLEDGLLVHRQSLPVGLAPVAVASPSPTEVWVVNHLSDSVSIVDISGDEAVVKRTLWVGDEPRDIVFAGLDGNKAFITTARRGQHHPQDPAFTRPSVGRASVWVFDAGDPGPDVGGTPLKVIELFGNTPRGLARSLDGQKVYVGIFHSGNATTILPADHLPKAEPTTDIDGNPAPDTGLIVRFDGSAWRDQEGRDWSDRVAFHLPDYDVFAIDAASPENTVLGQWSGVGTTLFNIAVNPVSGIVYVSNLESLNEVRFEGNGNRGSTLRGHFVENRITVIDGAEVLPRHLNRHLNYNLDLATASEAASSLAMPLEMAVSGNGNTLYVAAYGSAKIGIFSTAELESDTFTPSPSSHIELPGGGPAGVVLDEASGKLFALTRFDNALVAVDLDSRRITARYPLYNPEPRYVQEGRQFLYDARLTSSRGDSSCASCHIFGDLDLLAWDLGNPEEHSLPNPNAYVEHPGLSESSRRPVFHPLKGPMTTQSLRGMAENGPMHWRGDKTGLNRSSDESQELAAFKEFNSTFVNLLAREALLSDKDMTAFGNFALAMVYPPNPYRNLDNSLTPPQEAGKKVYFTKITTAKKLECNICHVLDVTAGHFGTSGLDSIEGPDFSQDMKVPHLRNLYTKVGMFGMGPKGLRSSPFMGDQIAGFGYTNDGAFDTIESFLSISVFNFDTPEERKQVTDFVLALDTDMAPIVGQQVTLSRKSPPGEYIWADLLAKRAAISHPRAECDLVAHGRIEGVPVALLLRDHGTFSGGRSGVKTYTMSQLKQMSQQQDNVITFTCVPPGRGELEAFGS